MMPFAFLLSKFGVQIVLCFSMEIKGEIFLVSALEELGNDGFK